MKIKHLTIVIIGVLTLALLCGSYLYLFSKRTDINIELRTINGDVEVLKDVIVAGDIINSTHKVSFELLNGEIIKTFKYGRFERRADNIYDLGELLTENAGYYIDYIMENKESEKQICVIYKNKTFNENLGFYELIEAQYIYKIELQYEEEKIVHAKTVNNKIVLIKYTKEGGLSAFVIDPEEKTLLREFVIDYHVLFSEYCSSIEISGGFMLFYFQGEMIYLLDIDNGQILQLIQEDKKRSVFSGSFYLYKNDTLYIMHNYFYSQYATDRPHSIAVVKILAYKNGKEVYEGEIESDIKYDDYYDWKVYQVNTRRYYNLRME